MKKLMDIFNGKSGGGGKREIGEIKIEFIEFAC